MPKVLDLQTSTGRAIVFVCFFLFLMMSGALAAACLKGLADREAGRPSDIPCGYMLGAFLFFVLVPVAWMTLG